MESVYLCPDRGTIPNQLQFDRFFVIHNNVRKCLVSVIFDLVPALLVLIGYRHDHDENATVPQKRPIPNRRKTDERKYPGRSRIDPSGVGLNRLGSMT